MDASGGLVFSQTVLLALARKGMSREAAYAIVQACAMKVWDGDLHLRDELKRDERVKAIMSDAEVDACFAVDDLLKNVDFIFARVGL